MLLCFNMGFMMRNLVRRSFTNAAGIGFGICNRHFILYFFVLCTFILLYFLYLYIIFGKIYIINFISVKIKNYTQISIPIIVYKQNNLKIKIEI